MNEQENVNLVKKLYEAFAKGDIEAILSHLTDDVHWSSPGPEIVPYSGEKIGRAQVRTFFEQLGSTQENTILTVNELFAHGDNVAMLGRYSGRIKATGIVFDTVIGQFSKIRDGKVANFISLVDTAQAAAAYGGGSTASHQAASK